MGTGSAGDRWAAVAAALPQQGRAERARPFWKALVRSFGWGRVVDAGCGAGFHLRLLRELGVDGVGFDAALGSVAGRLVSAVAGGDLLRPPLADGIFDAALCLGNTFSLLPSRGLQREALGALVRLVRPGGVVLLQGEDAAVLVARGPVVRIRRVDDVNLHVRVFERAGRAVRMLAGVVRDGAGAPLEEVQLLPTSVAAVARMAREIGLAPVTLPAAAPGGGASWWAAFSVRSP